jgi:hypothetical protein
MEIEIPPLDTVSLYRESCMSNYVVMLLLLAYYIISFIILICCVWQIEIVPLHVALRALDFRRVEKLLVS